MVKSHRKKAQKRHQKQTKAFVGSPLVPDLEKKSKSQRPGDELFPIVGIGASAGGLEAFTQLLKYIPSAPGMALVLIQHLDPKHDSLLAEILTNPSRMPVHQVVDGMTVEPDHVYVIPPNVNMAFVDKKLTLLPRTLTKGLHMPVDYFFRSLAKSHGNRAIGVILSGTASDGALGLEAIKDAGGVTLVQDDRTAKYTGMPRNAIATGSVDFILPIADIAEQLLKISRHPHLTSSEHVQIIGDAGSHLPLSSEYDRVLTMLKTASGVDFTHYKHSTIQRRIMRRMTLHKMKRLIDYIKYLKSNRDELDALYHDILIKVTGFFRDPMAFEALKLKVFPSFKSQYRNKPIRIWVPGCAGGEEVYSIAICLLEYLGNKASNVAIQIFATDIDEIAIEKARSGRYIENIAIDVSPQRLKRFFVKSNNHYRISKTIRDLCVFAKHNVVKDPPFSRIDLLSCRNLLIYLGSPLQKKMLSLFHYALNPTGFLLLGTSETTGTSRDLFRLVDKKSKIYTKNFTAIRPRLDFTAREQEIIHAQQASPQKFLQETFREADLYKEADRTILSLYAPTSVLINNQMEILQFRGDTSRYLVPASGKASFDLFKMAREGLIVGLRAAILQAQKRRSAVIKKNLRVRDNGHWWKINLKVIPIKVGIKSDPFFVVLFEEEVEPPVVKRVKGKSQTATAIQRSSHRQTKQLEQELAVTKEHLQSIIEEHESANEELKTANEEILSSNEELQSTNEELETAKEELQSTNEELTTVNDEIQNRNQELFLTNNDLNNVLASVDLAIVMLERNLRIRHFTPMAETVLKLIPTDIGRSIGDLRLAVRVPELERCIQEVIETASSQEHEAQNEKGRWFSIRIRPYRTLDNKIEGAVLVIVDIHELKMAEEVLRQAHQILEGREATQAVQLADMSVGKKRLELLSRSLMQEHEDERRTIARDLHDEIGQALTALKMNLQNSQPEFPTGGVSALNESLAIVDRLIQQVQHLSLNLRPSLLDELGLVATLRWWVQHQGLPKGVSLKLTAIPIEPRLPLDLATTCFRIVQEAVNNALKYAQARQICIALHVKAKRLDLVVSDDGAGFDVPSALANAAQGKTMGLVGLEERARAADGWLTITSNSARGTTVHANFPLNEPEAKP